MHDGAFPDALLGFDSNNEIDGLQNVAGVIQAWVPPPKIPVQLVPKGGDYL